MKKINRRKFLGSAATTTLVTALGANRATAATSQGKIGVALVGLGYYSQDLLAPALQLTQHCELRGIVTGSPEKIPVWQAKYGIKDSNIYNYDNLHQVADNPDIDVIYVVLPTSLHKKYTLIAANAGKHVWCEKPIAMTAADCQQMSDVCKKNKVQLTIGYRLRHEPNTQTVIEYAKSQPYGPIKDIIARAGYKGGAPSPDSWRLSRKMGGGAAYDMGVYPLNAARYTSAEEPIAVSARHEVYRPEVFKEVDEATFFTLEFPSGATAECATSVNENMNHLRANCEKGWYELKPFQSYSGVSGRTSDGLDLNKPLENQQAAQMDNDALAILNNSQVLVPGEVGLKDIRVVEAILKSAAQQGKRVTISES